MVKSKVGTSFTSLTPLTGMYTLLLAIAAQLTSVVSGYLVCGAKINVLFGHIVSKWQESSSVLLVYETVA